ncbi:3D domain-containing protein [Isachenkonia alkalipeptolytica]|uniref:G5 domain-containing protein n=1 Tax=Isachenkonia alkalipeptolytica TaxID=2565777 RepID=A0AA43XLM9_9CLOT|nr:3D domain-containing protein [Isachenkonia alkalipeptolytica]NBG89073.1 hypothetical protein [Isachenkonia alkalipeptolytica]
MEKTNFKGKLTKNKALLGLVAIIFLAVFFLGASHKTVIINADNQVIEVQTVSSEPEKILEEQEIEIGEYDRIEAPSEDNIRSGEEIRVHRGREIRVIDGGQEAIRYTTWNTLEDILEELEIELNSKDRVNFDLEETIEEEDKIEITRVREGNREETVELSYSTEVKYVEDLDPGEERVVQEGQSGEMIETYIDTYENGEKVSEKLQGHEVIETPENEIIEKGEVNHFTTADGSRVEYSRKITMEATAYTAGYESTGKRPGDPGYGVTRSGTRVRPGVVAVDPNVIPLGTKLYVESLDGTRSYGYSTAEDTGGAIKGNRIDLYFENLSAAQRYGRRDVRVYVID